jgi:D-amino-acid dehydrogenase
LARRGLEVVVVDDGVPGRATSAGAGIVSPIAVSPVSAERDAFAFAACVHYLELVARFEGEGLGDHSYGVTGGLIVALDEAELSSVHEVVSRSTELVARHGTRGAGQPVALDQGELAKRFPLLAPDLLGAVWSPEVARVDGRVIRDHLMTLAGRAGAATVDGRGSVVVDDGRVTAVRTPAGRIECDAAVLAGGAWSPDLADELGFALPVSPQRGQILHVRLPGASELPVVNGFRGHYLLSFPGDRVVVGATREDGSGFDTRATAGGVAQVIANGRTLVPSLDQAEWLELRVGLRPASRDGEPFVGPAPGIAGLYVSTGYGPQGLTFAPHAGALIASALAGETVEFPASFAVGRQ